jgi:MFS family permease
VGLAEVGYIYGSLMLGFGMLGLLAGGLLIDRLPKTGGWLLGLAALLIAGQGLASVLMPLAPSVTWAWIFCAAKILFMGPLYPIGAVVLSRITPGPMMGTMTALYFLPQNIIGAALGPTLVALLSQYMFNGPQEIGYAITVYATFVTVLALALLFALIRIIPDAPPELDQLAVDPAR